MYSNGLTTNALNKFTEWLKQVHIFELSDSDISAYLFGIKYPDEFSAGRIEIPKYFTKSRNPEVYNFDYDDFKKCNGDLTRRL